MIQAKLELFTLKNPSFAFVTGAIASNGRLVRTPEF